jgi:hypothetical protein
MGPLGARDRAKSIDSQLGNPHIQVLQPWRLIEPAAVNRSLNRLDQCGAESQRTHLSLALSRILGQSWRISAIDFCRSGSAAPRSPRNRQLCRLSGSAKNVGTYVQTTTGSFSGFIKICVEYLREF